MGTLFLIGSALLVGIGVLVVIAQFVSAGQTTEALRQHSGSNATPPMVSIDGRQGIAFNFASRTISIATAYGTVIRLPFEDVIAAELLKDGSVVQKTNRGSQVAGAAVGAALLGPVGLLAGAVTGKKTKLR